ncbi:hypothetical protein N665_0108s0030 [Sinapis alba]|nr:hypothetical protein N665_0108s0030 [Sinapis alba]
MMKETDPCEKQKKSIIITNFLSFFFSFSYDFVMIYYLFVYCMMMSLRIIVVAFKE